MVAIATSAVLFWEFVHASHRGLLVSGAWLFLATAIIALVLGVRGLVLSVKRARNEKAARLPWRFDEFTTTTSPRLGIVLSLVVLGLAGAELWGYFALRGDVFLLLCGIGFSVVGVFSLAVSVRSLRREQSTPSSVHPPV